LPDAPFWTCTIRATQAGDARFDAAAPVDRTFNFLKARTVIRVTSESNLVGAGPHSVLSTFGFVDSSMMSGLTSLAQLLTVSSLTPTTCRVNSNALWDRSGGVINRTLVAGLANGACTLKFDFPGSADRHPTSLTWNGIVSSIQVPTGSAITVQALSGNVVAGKEVFGPMSTTAPIMSLSGLDKGRVQMNVSVSPTNPAAVVGLDAQRRYNPIPSGSLRATLLTPSTCRFTVSTRSNSLNVTNNTVFVTPIAEGLCSVRLDFAGIRGWSVEASNLVWNATVTK